jgi:pimeloyl-ACP methyl ester carboxylesterase
VDNHHVTQLENFRLKVFRTVAEHLNFRKAAEHLFLTQPAITLQVKACEDDLGIRLFDRAANRDLSKSGAIKKTADGFTYLDPAEFHEYFAADLPAEQAAFMARSQVLNLADNFEAVITAAAWRSKPSWMLVAGSDRAISPDLERWYATRANSHKVEVSGASHAVYASRPKEVAALIQEAASHAR